MNLPKLYNRVTKNIEQENTYKVNGLAFLYNNAFGKTLTNAILSKKISSKAYAKFVKSKNSIAQIPGFIEHYNINTEEIKNPIDSFESFNDFFIRELKDDARPIDSEPNHLISPADSRLMIFNLSEGVNLAVKGYWYTLEELIKDKKMAEEYSGGWCFVYRLAPSDYHRYCYIDDGSQEEVKRIKGILHSVHPIALNKVNSVMSKNYRELTLLKTKNFGEVLQIEVGALFVGKIIQHHNHKHIFSRGEEKGYFEFGGSTVIQLFKKDTICPDEDIKKYSSEGIETLIKIGEKVGYKL